MSDYIRMMQDMAQVNKYELAAMREDQKDLKKLTEYIMNAPWFNPITMTGRSSVDVIIERDKERP